ncbi:heme NO-binding domain-containing protein [Bradyrhizobium sp. ORS 111]|uniref:heme NO-binding domain-containing protein n=1 Tax=Bradyrhizobium sp. ORS 111 TaxID=1685958 RepID=UPI00388D49DF
MKGVIFNVLEEVVTQQFSQDVWESLVDKAAVDGAYTSLGNYADEDLVCLVASAAEVLGKTPGEILRWFGQSAMPLLAARYPSLFESHRSSRDFILSVNKIIHPEVRKLYAGASCPFFHFKPSKAGSMMMAYESPRKLCMLAQGFIEGAARHYHDDVDVHHRECMHKGDEKCLLEIKWAA